VARAGVRTAAIQSLAAAFVVLTGACGGGGSATITVSPADTFQTMTGWEFTAQGGQDQPPFLLYGDSLIGLAVHQLGVNRIRLEVRSGMEHTRDYWRESLAGNLTGDAARCARYQTANDNADPRLIAPGGFQFGELDREVEALLLPLKRALEARGERLVVNVTYVSFYRQCARDARYDHQPPDEYAEFALAVATHLRDRFGVVPDYWEMILEPDNTDFWNGRRIGEAMVATALRFREHGLPTRFVAPSNTSVLRAIEYFDALARVPGADTLVAELAYHRYHGVSHGALREVAVRGRAAGIRTAMLEKIAGTIDDLLDDLTIAQASAWQQYALAHIGAPEDRGGLYYRVDMSDSAHPVIRPAQRTPMLAQVFRHVRLGAVRVGATSSSGGARGVAFRNPDGRFVLVARTRGAGTVEVAGLPPGRYGATWTTQDSAGAAADTTIAANGRVAASIPGAGVLTVFGR
jgi:hypothetical protein